MSGHEKAVIRVLTIDDHPMLRNGISAMLEADGRFKVVAESATAEEGLLAFAEHRPDITLMDLQMPGLGGIQGIRELRQRWPAARVVVLTTYRGDANAHEALQAGALGYLLKSALRDELISCLLMVNEGKRHICAEVCSDIAAYIGGERLTPREKRILELMAEGLENKRIGDVLSISSETVKSHTCALFAKLNVHNRSEAVRVGWRRGMLMPPNR